MTTTDDWPAFLPSRRKLWSGMICDDPEAEVGILGIPFDGAVCHRPGTAEGPSRVRQVTPIMCRSTEEGVKLDLRLRDYGDVAPDLDWERYFRTVEEMALQVLGHPFALFLGGDHSVTIPVMRAFDQVADGPFGVLHFDAHFDLFDSLDGHQWSHACTERRALELPGMEPQRLVFVGVRSFCDEEIACLDQFPEIQYFTARQCYLQGIEAIIEQVVEHLKDVPTVYLTLDIDGLDPAYAPGTGTPEGGGLSTRELLELVRSVVSQLPVQAMDLVEVSPPLDHSDVTSYAAAKVIYEALGAVQERVNGA